MTCLQAAVEFILELQLDDDPVPTPSASHTHTHTHTLSGRESQSQSCVVRSSGPDSECSEEWKMNRDIGATGGGMAGEGSPSHAVESNCSPIALPSSSSSHSPSSSADSSVHTSSAVQMQVQDPSMPSHRDLDLDREKKREKDCTAGCADKDGDREGDGNRSLKTPGDDGYAAVIKLGEMRDRESREGSTPSCFLKADSPNSPCLAST
jgi:hypothetical protein